MISWTERSASDLSLSYVSFPDEPPGGVAGFEVELLNGLYYVTVGGGNVGYDSSVRMAVEGNVYRADDDSKENLYILDVAPEPVGSRGPLKWDLSQDLDKHGAPVSGRVRTWGAYESHPSYYTFAELLYLKDQIVEVTDGKLTIHGADVEGGGFLLNFVEVVKMNISDCNNVWDNGFGLSPDLNEDCRVDMQDFAIMALDWAQCYDPNDLGDCPVPEEW